MRELLEMRAAAPVTGYDDVGPPPVERSSEAAHAAPAAPVTPAAPATPAARGTGGKEAGEKHSASPVLGSIVEQFGKLRQQRALDRQIGKKSR